MENRYLTVNKCIEYSLKWTIENFDRNEDVGRYVESPTFTSTSNDKLKWNVHIYPNGDREENREYVSIVLRLIESDDAKIRAKFKFDAFNSGRKLIKTTTLKYHVFETSKSQRCKLIKRDQLFNRSVGLLPDNVLVLVCKVKVFTDQVTSKDPSKLAVVRDDRRLGEDFGRLLESQQFVDVTLVAEGREIGVHKVLLVSRSDVFRAMFAHDTKECQSNRVAIDDVQFDVLKEMIRFMYTDEAPNLSKIAHLLLPIADKYSLDKLKTMCEQSMATTVTPENACEYFVLADLHGADALKQRIIEFVNAHAADILKNASWKNVPKECQQSMTEMLLKAMAANRR